MDTARDEDDLFLVVRSTASSESQQRNSKTYKTIREGLYRQVFAAWRKVIQVFHKVTICVSWKKTNFQGRCLFDCQLKWQFEDFNIGKFSVVVDPELNVSASVLPWAAFFPYIDPSSFIVHTEVSFKVTHIQCYSLTGIFFAVFNFEGEPTLMAVSVCVIFEVQIELVLPDLGDKLQVGILVVALEL